tara:strand:- start:678 stop:1553 length:876 start_codon:yes stop_codon:yes gene_type:complete
MAYIGNQNPAGFAGRPPKQDLTGATGGTLTLSNSVSSSHDIELFINNVRQEPETSYQAAGTVVTLQGYTVSATDDIYVNYKGLAQLTSTVDDGSIGSSKIVDGSITSAKLSPNINISGTVNTGTIKEATGTTTAMTIDSDGQVVLSAIPYIRLEVTGTPNTTIGPDGYGIVPYDSVLASRGITHNTSTFHFQVPVAGLYNLQGNFRWNHPATYLWWRVAKLESGVRTLVQNIILLSTGSNGSSFITAPGSILLPLEASKDYRIEFSDGSTNNTKVVQGGQSYMTIHLVGGV